MNYCLVCHKVSAATRYKRKPPAHVMKAHKESGRVTLLILNLGSGGASRFGRLIPWEHAQYSLYRTLGMRWAGHVARMVQERGAYRVLVGKPEGKRPLERPRRRWVDNIRMDLQEVGCGYVEWIGLAQDRDSWRTLVSAVMNLRVP